MSRRFICVLLIINSACCILVDSNDLAESPTEDKLLANIVRARNASKTSHPKDSHGTENSDKTASDKQPRTVYHRLDSDYRDNCCGYRYGSDSSKRPDSYRDRYPSKFGDRLPHDRYGWQSHEQPTGLSGSAGRPGSSAGNSFYEGSRGDDRFSFRPSYGSESSNKPGSYDSGAFGGYGGPGGYTFARPSNHGGAGFSDGHGISGTLGTADDYGLLEPNYPEGNSPPHPNIQTQKAVALKALAGVALLGAAAALATNPVLLPLGIVSGRRKRSSFSADDKEASVNHILSIVRSHESQMQPDESGINVSLSPTCIARLACEVQKRRSSSRKSNINTSKQEQELEHHLTGLMSRDASDGRAKMRIKNFMESVKTFFSNGGNCHDFPCTVTRSIHF